MNTHDNFLKYCEEITLNSSHEGKLRAKRDIIRNKIRDYFTKNNFKQPRFTMQGSFSMGTTIIPLAGEYDIDDGIYLMNIDISTDISEWCKTETVHSWVYKAVEEHTEKIEDKARCVRVTYRDDINYHIDLPIYVHIEHNNKCYIAEKGEKQWNESDPKLIKEWFQNEINKRGEQLRRIIIYLKGWKDYREYNNLSLKLLGGFQLTVLASKYYIQADSDEESFYKTIQNIATYFDINSKLDNPVNLGLNLLEYYSDSRKIVIKQEINDLSIAAEKAFTENDANISTELWQKVFGDRFKLNNKSRLEKLEEISRNIIIPKPWVQ